MTTKPHLGDSALAARLRREIEGEVLFDAFSRGRYSTDASHYQIEPIGVVVAKTEQDIHRAIQIAADAGIPVLPRGAGTSQCGQTVGEALVIDVSKHRTRLLEGDRTNATPWGAPGLVDADLHARLPAHGPGESEFRLDLNQDAMATEKLAEGIRNFIADQVKLEQVISQA